MNIHDLNLSDLKYFIDAVENKSLTRSSELNHITRPAISKAIARLGDWFGSPLLTHQKNAFDLTVAGEDLYRVGKLAYQQMEEGLSKKSLSSNRIKVGCSASLAEAFLTPAIKSMEMMGEIDISIGTSKQVRRKLEDEEIDFGLILDDLIDPDVGQEVIYHGNFILASTSKDFSETLIMTEDRPEVLAAKAFLKKRRIKFSREIRVESWSVVSQMARSLKGACVLPDFLARPPLSPIHQIAFSKKFNVSIIHHGRQFLNRSEIVLLDLIKMRTKEERSAGS